MAVGHDQLPAKIYKDTSESLCHTICRLINLSYKTSTFPATLKHAIVKPVFKNKGSLEDPQFYRPLSILTVLSKIFEKSAKHQITSYLEEHGKLYESQHAYRKHHSTTTSLAEITDYLHKEIEEKRIPAIVSTDLSKAFDTVSHPLLLQKLEKMGLGSDCTSWIQSYLSNRTQVTSFPGQTSDVCTIESGVPQGSILGPILFIAFTTDLAKEVPESKIVAYADDAAILVSASNLETLQTRIEKILQQVQEWYTSNGLLINPSKTEYMVLGKGNIMEINVKEGDNNIPIQSKKHLKVLGVTIDQRLSWNEHVTTIKKKTTNAIRNIARTSAILPLKSRQMLTEALVTPHYNYCDVVYDGCSEKAKNNLQRNQNYAARALLGRSKYSSATEALKQLNWLPLEKRRKLHTAVFVHKAVHSKSSKHAIHMVEGLRPQHTYRTRQVETGYLYNKTHRTAQLEKSISYRSTKVWNEVPSDLRMMSSATAMKSKWQGREIDNFKTIN